MAKKNQTKDKESTEIPEELQSSATDSIQKTVDTTIDSNVDDGLKAGNGSSSPPRIELLHTESVMVNRYFSEEQINELARENARNYTQAEEIKNSAKAAAADYKSQLANINNVIATNSRKINDGFEPVQVMAKVFLDYDRTVRVYVDPQGAVIKEIPFKPQDYQLKMTMEGVEPEKIPVGYAADFARDVFGVENEDIPNSPGPIEDQEDPI